MCVFIARVMTALKLTSEIKSASNCSLGQGDNRYQLHYLQAGTRIQKVKDQQACVRVCVSDLKTCGTGSHTAKSNAGFAT